MRPLFVKAIRQIQSSSGRSRSTKDNNFTPEYEQSGAHASHSNIKRGRPTTTNESEEDILADGNGILMTRQISIRYEESGGACYNSDGRE